MINLFKFKPKCEHVFYYMKDMTSRDRDGYISCICNKCKKVFKADCGLNLPGELKQ